MRISFVVPDSMSACRGGMKRIAEYASRLSKRGHDIFILSPDKEIPEWLSSYKGTYRLANIDGYRTFKTDIAIATGGRSARRLGRMTCAKKKAYSVVMLESMNKPTEKHGKIIDRDFCLKDPYKQGWIYYANSTWLKEAVETKFGQKCHIILAPPNENLHPTRSFRPEDKIWTLGYGHGSWKGGQRTADATFIAQKMLPNLEMIHFSSRGRPKSPALSKHWDKPSLDKLARIYSSANIFIHSSMFEGFANTCAEALSCGTPVISYKTPGIEDLVIHNETGIIVEKFDVNEMAKAIIDLLTNKELYSKIKANTTKHMQQFTWDKTLNMLEQVFEEGLRRK